MLNFEPKFLFISGLANSRRNLCLEFFMAYIIKYRIKTEIYTILLNILLSSVILLYKIPIFILK